MNDTNKEIQRVRRPVRQIIQGFASAIEAEQERNLLIEIVLDGALECVEQEGRLIRSSRNYYR